MSNPQRIHFIGIGGIGMSALARHYLHEGWQVSGTDAAESELTQKLGEEGATVAYTQDGALVTEHTPDLVVYTEAIAKDNPELLVAKERGIETINYFEALGRVANEYYLIAVAGTHGKTTTTAMLADILEEASLDPTVVVGSLRSKTGSNYRPGRSKYMIVEACEYKRDFLTLTPDVLVITNLEHEHVDYYKNLADVQAAFRELAGQVREGGAVVCDPSDPAVQPVIDGQALSTVDYRSHIDLNLKLHLPGLHNRQNAAAASAAAAHLGIESATIKQALENFAGTWRRFEYQGDVNGAPVYDDYAHHPTEIVASVAGARELYPDKKLTVVFQSHTYSRTRELRGDFVAALSKADRVFMLPIYAARAEDRAGINTEDLVADLTKVGTEAQLFHTHAAAALEIKETVGNGDVVLIMGAGDVTQVAGELTK
jgi:UDP-N-acetylmuramate--alanine ligase